MKKVALALSASAFWLLSGTAHAEDEPIPQRYPPSSVRPKLIGGGIAIAGLAYGGTVLTATSWPDYPAASALYVPVAGPWISLVQSKCPATEKDCGAELYVRGVLLAVEGIVQLGGLGLIGEGIFMTTEAESKKPKAKESSAFLVYPVPIVSAGFTGLGLTGRF